MTKSVTKKVSGPAKKHSVAFKYLDELVASEMKVFYAAYNMPVTGPKKSAVRKTARKTARA